MTVNGVTLGCIEKLVWTRHHVDLDGWFSGQDLQVGQNSRDLSPVPFHGSQNSLPMEPEAALCAMQFQFRLERTSPHTGVTFLATDARGNSVAVKVTPPGSCRVGISRICALPFALRLVASRAGDILHFLQTGDAGLSVSLRDTFGFNEETKAAPLMRPDILVNRSMSLPMPRDPLLLIIPIHNAHQHVARLLKRLADCIDVDHGILLIDDGSSESEIGPLLSDFAARFPDRVPHVDPD